MAKIVPSTIRGGATSGERKLFNIFRDELPDDVIVYYEPFIYGRTPDYVLIIPSLGILILEVKDYRISSIEEGSNPEQWIIFSNGVRVTVKNPLTQARDYSFLVCNKLKRDPFLVQGGDRSGNLKFPYAFGVVFTNITREEYLDSDMCEIIDDNKAIFKDDLEEEDLFEIITSMFGRWPWFNGITEEEVERIRFNMFPEIRVTKQRGYDENKLLSLKTLRTMDLYQESLAKNIGEGHRLIRGVAGSGKTLILIARARLLSKKYKESKILILCYSVTLAANIFNLINDEEEYPNIEVLTFNEFLYKAFRVRNVERIPQLLDGINSGKIKVPKYDHILLDETQDFEDSWLKVIVSCLSEEHMSLLMVEDKAQDIFKRKTSLASATGLDFRGRARILSINYRNPRYIASLAWQFHRKFLDRKESDIISPKFTDRLGHKPIIKKFDTFWGEVKWVCGEINKLIHSGVKLSDIAILYRVRKTNQIDYIATLSVGLNKANLAFRWVSENRESKASYDFRENRVSLLTLDSSKGLDFKYVFIINADNIPFPLQDDIKREASLMYIGLTRATEALYITYSSESVFTQYLESLLESNMTTMNYFKG